MKVMTVCRMNQARSPFAEAVLAAHFPELELTSAGVLARKDSTYLAGVVAIARRWGIDMRDGFSRELINNRDLASTDLVICAEESMRDAIRAQNFTGELISFEDVVPDPSFMPKDPEMLRGRKLETELAKVAWINVQCMNERLDVAPKFPITSVIPEREANLAAAISWAVTESKSTGALLVDADLRVPIAREFRKLGLRLGILSDSKNPAELDVLSNITEDGRPEMHLISREWSQQISDLAKIRPLIMVTAPQLTELGPLPDSFLAAMPASRVEIIRI